MTKLVFDPDTERLLGGGCVVPGAVELIAAREQKMRDQGKDPRAPKAKKTSSRSSSKSKTTKKKTKKKAKKKTKKSTAKKKSTKAVADATV